MKRGVLNVRFAPKATELLLRREMMRWANNRHRPLLFDHLVGAAEQRRGHFYAVCLASIIRLERN
jgi:hypothetical protein